MKNCFWPIFILLYISTSSGQQKVFYINSYHVGYPSSDQVEAAIQKELKDSFDLKTFYLNAKKASPKTITKNAKKAWKKIKKFKPEIILVSDDNAVESFVVTYLEKLNVPILFCGVNWSAEKYGLPAQKVTGMLETLPVVQCLETIEKSNYEFDSITILSENSTAEIKNKNTLTPIFESRRLKVTYKMVRDYSEWKNEFLKSQFPGNIVFMPTNGSIKNWDNDNAEIFTLENTKVPTFSCDDFMVRYACFGLTKVSLEQGEYVAKTAKKILTKEVSVKDIPIVRNQMTECRQNTELLNKLYKDHNTILNCNQ